MPNKTTFTNKNMQSDARTSNNTVMTYTKYNQVSRHAPINRLL